MGSDTPTTHFKTSVATTPTNTTLIRPMITESTIGSLNAVSTPRTLFQIRVGDLTTQNAKNTTIHKKIAVCRAFKS